MEYIESVINSGLLNDLKKTEYIAAFEQLKVSGKKYRKGEPIYYEGDQIDRVCIVASGSVCAEKTYRDGGVHIVRVFDTNSIFGLDYALSKTKKSAVDFISHEDSTIVFVHISSILRSDYSENLIKSLVYRLADDNIRMSRKAEILAERGLRERIMTFLNILATKSGSNSVSANMNREQLAQFLCVNRSALSNELNKMKKEGIIDFKKDKFTIL